MKDISFFLFQVVYVVVMVSCFLLGIQGVYMVVDNVSISVKVDGKEIYHGPSYGINVKTAGANSGVTVKGGFMCLFPKAYYISKNVEVVNEKKVGR